MCVCMRMWVCVPSCCAEHCLYIVGRISWGTLWWWGVALPRGREAEWSTSPAFLLSLFTKPRLLSGNFLSHAVSVHLWHVAVYHHWPASDTGMHFAVLLFWKVVLRRLNISFKKDLLIAWSILCWNDGINGQLFFTTYFIVIILYYNIQYIIVFFTIL